jgi:hypothetical protein
MKPLTDNAQAIRNHIEQAWKLADEGAVAQSGLTGDPEMRNAYAATRDALATALEEIEKVRR